MKKISQQVDVVLLLRRWPPSQRSSRPAPAASVGKKAASVQVCVLLPDTKSSVRWVQFDAPDFAKALKAAGVTYSITNALNDPQKQKAQAQACLAAGAKVVVETALDNGSAASIEKLVHVEGREGDRLRPPGDRRHRVRLRHLRRQGRRRGAGARASRRPEGARASTKPVVAELWGGQTDQNAFWFKSGNDAVLNPLFKSGTLDEGPAAVRAGLARHERRADLRADARQDEQQDRRGRSRRTTTSPAPSIADLKARHLKPIPLSGQDATPQGVQYILAGWQTGTVYKYVPDRGERRGAAAVALLKGQKPKTNTTGRTARRSEPTLALPVGLDHEGELQAALHGQVPEEERRLHRRRTSSTASRPTRATVEAPGRAPPPLSGRKRPTVDETPLLELRGITKSFGSVQALTDVDFEVRHGEVMALVGDNGAGKSTLIKCVAGTHAADSGEILFEGKRGAHPRAEGRGQARDRGRLPGPRALRQPRRRPEHVPRPRGARLAPAPEGADHGAEDGRDAEVARRHDDPLDPPAGRHALRRPAAVGRGREGRAVELEARDPRRADRRARRRPDRAGARARQAPRRAGPRGRASSRTTCTTSSRPRRASPSCASAGTSASTSARRRPSRRSSRRSRPACRRRSPASRDAPERRREHEPTSSGRTRPRRRRTSSGGVAGLYGARVDNLKSGNLGVLPIVDRARSSSSSSSASRRRTSSPANNFDNIIIQMAGTTMLAYGVVFVLLLGEIDLSISYVAGIGALTVAELQLPGSGHQVNGLIAMVVAVAVCAR